jgi:hypothetical protein
LSTPAFFYLATPGSKFKDSSMSGGIPLWAIVLDYLLGMVMWTLIGRFGMSLFLPEDSKFFFSRFFVKVTNPLIRAFAPITPGFLIAPLVPLYVAWFFYMARFYLMPWLLGYSVMGMLSFPLESEIGQAVARTVGVVADWF